MTDNNPTCSRCGATRPGYAFIAGQPYCHPDYPGPSDPRVPAPCFPDRARPL